MRRHANSKKLRRGQAINRLQRIAVAAAGRGKGGSYQFAVAVEVHGRPIVSNKRAQQPWDWGQSVVTTRLLRSAKPKTARRTTKASAQSAPVRAVTSNV